MNTLKREWVGLEREKERERERERERETKGQEREIEKGDLRENEWDEREETSLSKGKKNDEGVTMLKVLGIKLSFRDLIG